jgi:glucokinase
VGLDVGGTTVKAGLVARDGTVLLSRARPTPPAGRLEEIERTIAELLRELDDHDGAGTVGAGLPGVVDHARGVVRHSPNVEAFTGWEARDRLSDIARRPVVVDNDANCAAVAEGWVGAAAGVDDFLMVTLGTGVGGGVVLGGHLWHGEAGRAGELGHVTVDPQGAPCGCGSRGCLETVASATGIARMARECGREGDAESLARAARSGDPAAARLFERAGSALGIAVAAWLDVMDVHTVVVGGGMAAALDLMEPALRDEIALRAYALHPDDAIVRRAAVTPTPGVVGAARLAMLEESRLLARRQDGPGSTG